MKWAKNQSGFTIVELLIVIVVIAILAAITIVGYTGIQNRAKESSAKSTLSSAYKKIAVYSTGSADVLPASLDAAGVQGTGITYEYVQASKYYCVAAQVGSFVFHQSTLNPDQLPGPCAPTTGLVAWWPLNASPKDYAGAGYDGALMNTPTSATGENGKANGAYSFSSSASQYISLPTTTAVPVAQGSLSVWARSTSSGDSQNFFYYGDAGEDGCTGAPSFALSSCGFVLQTTASGATSTPFTGFSTDDTWYNVTSVWDGSGSPRYIRTYVNGVQVASGVLSTTPSLTPAVINIGRAAANSRYMNGSLDDLRVYNRPLSAAEVTTIYQSGAE